MPEAPAQNVRIELLENLEKRQQPTNQENDKHEISHQTFIRAQRQPVAGKYYANQNHCRGIGNQGQETEHCLWDIVS